jgi:hypothetical protein
MASVRTAKAVIATGSISDRVDYAIELYRQIKSATQELLELKANLRKLAAKRNPQKDRPVLIEGLLGTAQVVFSEQAPRARKGVDLLAIEPGLPAEVFNALFVKRTTVTFAEDFTEKLAALSPKQRTVIAQLIEAVESTPKVILPK